MNTFILSFKTGLLNPQIRKEALYLVNLEDFLKIISFLSSIS